MIFPSIRCFSSFILFSLKLQTLHNHFALKFVYDFIFAIYFHCENRFFLFCYCLQRFNFNKYFLFINACVIICIYKWDQFLTLWSVISIQWFLLYWCWVFLPYSNKLFAAVFCLAHQILNMYTNTKIKAWHWLAPVSKCNKSHLSNIYPRTL